MTSSESSPPSKGPSSESSSTINCGLTATRAGLTGYQKTNLNVAFHWLSGNPKTANFKLLNGCAIGGDEEASLLLPSWRCVGFPARHKDSSEKARRHCGELRAEAPPLTRNGHILAESHTLFGCPQGEAEELRSGTWATVRAARRMDLPLVLFLPSGQVRFEPGRSKWTDLISQLVSFLKEGVSP